MLTIRLQRIGKKHQPSFRVVVAEKRSKLGGPPVDDLGAYNPFTKSVAVAKEKVEHWLKSGAKPTPSVHNLLVKQGVISGKKIPVKIRKKVTGAAEESVTRPAEKAEKAEKVETASTAPSS